MKISQQSSKLHPFDLLGLSGPNLFHARQLHSSHNVIFWMHSDALGCIGLNRSEYCSWDAFNLNCCIGCGAQLHITNRGVYGAGRMQIYFLFLCAQFRICKIQIFPISVHTISGGVLGRDLEGEWGDRGCKIHLRLVKTRQNCHRISIMLPTNET